MANFTAMQAEMDEAMNFLPVESVGKDNQYFKSRKLKE